MCIHLAKPLQHEYQGGTWKGNYMMFRERSHASQDDTTQYTCQTEQSRWLTITWRECVAMIEKSAASHSGRQNYNTISSANNTIRFSSNYLLAGRSRDPQGHDHMTRFVQYLEFILDGSFQFFMLQYHIIPFSKSLGDDKHETHTVKGTTYRASNALASSQ